MKNQKKIITIFLVLVVIIITFYNQFAALTKDIAITVKEKESRINRHIDLSKGFIDLISIYGNDFFEHGTVQDADLYSMLTYDSATNTYNLDSIGGTKYEKTAGNLTGMGTIPASGVNRDEMNLALYFNQQFSSLYSKLPDVAWLYYTSKNNFINIYPWVASKNFAFQEVLKTEKFFEYVKPQNDPLRESVWTPVYLDHAGKGLMVTLSSPIYVKDEFMGAVSLDLTNQQISDIIKSDYEIYIMDDTDSIIATSTNYVFDKDTIKFNTFLNTSLSNIEAMKKASSDSVLRMGNYLVYSVSFMNAPWKMFIRVPIWLIIWKSTFYTLPILVICLLLLFNFFEVEKRKKTEVLLTNSLSELTSYQKLLENAAKYDFLTSTVNRRGLFDIFNKNVDSEGRTEQPVAFIMGDIDWFKLFNDTYGHAAGDKVLIEIAGIMQMNIGNNEVVCRYGGEEFVIMLFDRTYEEALVIAETIRQEIEANVILWKGNQELHATMTFGVAEHADGDLPENSISKADHALYHGKNAGRNRVAGYRSYEQ